MLAYELVITVRADVSSVDMKIADVDCVLFLLSKLKLNEFVEVSLDMEPKLFKLKVVGNDVESELVDEENIELFCVIAELLDNTVVLSYIELISVELSSVNTDELTAVVDSVINSLLFVVFVEVSLDLGSKIVEFEGEVVEFVLIYSVNVEFKVVEVTLELSNDVVTNSVV